MTNSALDKWNKVQQYQNDGEKRAMAHDPKKTTSPVKQHRGSVMVPTFKITMTDGWWFDCW